MKNGRACFIALMSFALQNQAASQIAPVFNQALFIQNAELYGNKTANLMELEKIAAYLNSIQNKKIFAVPPFFGLSSPEVIVYLSTMPYEQTTVWAYILEQWKEFVAAQSKGATLLTEGARTALTNIRVALASTLFDVNGMVNKENADRHARLIAFLNNAVEQNKLLMVRSTGREDGKELSNAGGNASIASVPPVIEALSKAIQEVLESYSGEKSIGQRLIGKDKHLFDTPFMAVLLQVMMGEVYGVSTEIPKSGVMFSPEAEGETPGVVVIQATFGHNEGVVNGLVPVDTYYVGPTNIIHPLISIKSKRLAALPGKEGLHFVENDPELQRISTLDPETVLVLKEAAQFVQQYYGNSVDIEFVIVGDIIYFVQARPLEDKKFEASYLKKEFIDQTGNPILSVVPIGVGNAAVRIIERPDQVIITENIRQALEAFLFKTADQNSVQAIIIKEPAPATSHEATQFRRIGKPVLYAQEFDTVKVWLQQLSTSVQATSALPVASSLSFAASSSSTEPILLASVATGRPLLIDVQRALITTFIPSETFQTPESIIELGWYAHPIAKKVSLMREFMTSLPEDAMRELMPEEFFKNMQTTQLIDKIKQSEPDEARKALRSLIHRVWATLQKIRLTQNMLTITQPNLNAQLKHIFANMLTSAYEINEALKRADASRLERLYPIVFLEALVSQLPEPRRLVNDYSFGSILKTEQQEQQIMYELQLRGNPERARIAQYAKANEYALVPEIKNNFDRYLLQMSSLPDLQLKDSFAQLMYNLAQFNILPLWLNTSFEYAYTAQQGDAQKITDVLLSENVTAADFMKQLQQMQKSFASFNVLSFEDPAAFNKQFNILLKIVEVTASSDFIDNFESTTRLGKTAALQVMRTAVDIFDRSIKALTGSKLYTDEVQKIDRFKTMLEYYIGLLESWAFIPSIESRLNDMIDNITFKNISQYIENIRTNLARITSHDALQLHPSKSFNVAGAALGSKAYWKHSAPNPLTLEDIFTLIHQNLLIVLGALTGQAGLSDIMVPSVVQTLQSAVRTELKINDDYGKYITPNLIGASFEEGKLMYFYNLPLLNHSCTFQITYALKTKKTTLSIQLHGQARERWLDLGDLAYILSDLSDLELNCALEINNRKGELSFCWEINTPEKAVLAIKYLRAIAQTSISFSSSQKAYQGKINKEDKHLPWAYYLRIIASENEMTVSTLRHMISNILYNILESNTSSGDIQRAIRILRKIWFLKDAPYSEKDRSHSLLQNISENKELLSRLDMLIKKFIDSTSPEIQIGIIKLVGKLIELKSLPDPSIISRILALKGNVVSRMIQESFLPKYLQSEYSKHSYKDAEDSGEPGKSQSGYI